MIIVLKFLAYRLASLHREQSAIQTQHGLDNDIFRTQQHFLLRLPVVKYI
jgi:hypothetical protein